MHGQTHIKFIIIIISYLLFARYLKFYIHATNHISKVHNVARILWLQCYGTRNGISHDKCSVCTCQYSPKYSYVRNAKYVLFLLYYYGYYYYYYYYYYWNAVAQLVEALRYTHRKVAGSIPDGVIWIFHSLNPSGHAMALELTASKQK